ncbi:phage gp6-like head-tail connector protein [Microbacterium rhizomatis]|uniref:Phage gp6-like head-tail connector protein n=1 Tax=Microbacterium rhizomatis TaxID=1631477 RepID=A0A5J5J2A0_9MICO|nr:phage gp6-like head-tail connector protein [Microbacterium rhizomatis]KAA9110180.1 phage gp6-like head-tail connector protein [Microbacterium rhizomatis]
MASNWPLGAADLRKALDYQVGQDDAGELTLYMSAACERIDKKTGRRSEPTRHEVDGKVPVVFLLAARKLAKLWWTQDKRTNRTGRQTGDEIDPSEGVGGVDLPRVVAGMLADYPDRLYPVETP